MILDRLTISNFMSFGSEQSIELGSQGLVFIEGENRDDPLAKSNGAGKSVLLEAVVWALTGKTVRGLKADEVIHRKVGKDCVVELSGTQNGQTWEVRRYRKVERRSGLSFKVGGVDLTTPDVAETQAQVYAHLKTTYDLLTNTILFGQGARWRFSELTDAPRKALLDQMIGAEVLARALSWVKGMRTSVDDEIGEAQAEASKTIAMIEATEEAIENVQRAVRLQHKKQLGKLEEKLEEVREDLREVMQTKIDSSLPERLEEAEGESANLESEIELAQEDLDGAIEDRHRIQAEYEQIDKELKRVSQKLKDARALKPGTVCDHCGSKITKEFQNDHTFYLVKEVKRVEALKQKRESMLEDSKKLVRGDQDTRQNLIDAKRKCDAELKQLRIALKAQEEHQHLLGTLRKERDKLRQEITDHKAQKTTASTKKLEKKLEKLRAKDQEIEMRLSTLYDDRAHYDFWVTGFGNAGIKSHLLDHIVPILNKRAAKFAGRLMDGLVIEFDSESTTKKGELRDKFEVSVINKHGADVYAGNSGGEKRKADIVVARTLQSLEEDKSSCNVAWWDEVFESLDETSCEAVMGMLREEAKNKPSVFVVSHLEWLRSHFPRVLRVVKEDGFSRVEWS